MGFGLNVQLVFRSALNIVQLFTAAAVVTVVQHCSRAQICPKQCVWGQIFARAASGGAQSKLKVQTPKVGGFLRRRCLSVSVPAGRFQLFPGQNCQIKVIWGSGRPSGSYCSTKILNVELLLFTALAVVLLFMFNMNNSRGLPTFHFSS